VARKRAQPGDDVLSWLCATEETGDDEIAMLSMFLLFAGHETTVTAIGTGTLLLTEPGQRQALGREPALVTAAVEEILRAGGQGRGGIPRYARAGLRIADVRIRPGDLVLLDNGAANHDRRIH
jgi:cytochrome P450